MIIILNMQTTPLPTAKPNARFFSAFVVVALTGNYDVEIHTVGASSMALDQLVDQIESLTRAALAKLTDDNKESCADCTVIRIGNHPDVATGLRIVGVEIEDRGYLREFFRSALSAELDDVMEAI